MPIEFACPVCSKRFKVDDQHVGRKTTCKACGAAITVPEQGEAQLAGNSIGGSTLYDHSHKVKQGFEIATGDDDLIEAVSRHIEKHIGPVESVFHEIISETVHVDIFYVKPTQDRPYYTLITSGMAERPMTTPPGAEELAYAELILCLPASWPLTEKAFQDEANYWPIRWMKILARFPHDYETFFTVSHTIPGGNPPEEFDASTPMGCWMFIPPIMFDEAAWEMEHDGHTVHFLYMLPLHLDEMEFKLKVGYDEATDRLMDSFSIIELIDMQRPSFYQLEASGQLRAARQGIVVHCPCGATYDVETSLAGQTTPCRKCGQPVYASCSTLALSGKHPAGAAASHPAGVRMSLFRYYSYRPIEYLWWLIPLLLFLALGGLLHWGFFVLAALLLVPAALRPRALRYHFMDGDTCAAVVVSLEPPLLAVLTDVNATGFGDPQMVIKIMSHYLRELDGVPVKLGQKVVAAAFYTQDFSGEERDGPKRWGDFEPLPIQYGSGDPAALRHVMSQVSKNTWRQLQEGVKQIPRPFQPGIYDVDV
ncbi:DUF3239 domain-containing protein [Blastopirellula sp. J2-11]|uniref:DUF3239 domain-containing protein n=1 Tax=Blastopirellula sp. J2-11 TaxID=2943192 RepID=UPI0021C7CE69|nr:DUF3239 domain-containing protein [Blastopirellula sp. J2-11]UUO06616.1 DUF3239 domain-containing protein [Blastopirellula sp. J2-11]